MIHYTRLSGYLTLAHFSENCATPHISTYVCDDKGLVTSRPFLARSMLCSCRGYAGPGLLAAVFQPKGINMHYSSVTKKSLFSAAVCALLAAAPAKATNYDETVSGDLSNNQAAPTAL